MSVFEFLLLSFLILCAVSVCLAKNLMVAVILQMSYSLIMTILWIVLESPDLAITEAAVGTGITSLLFFVALRKTDRLDEGASFSYSSMAEEAISKRTVTDEETLPENISEDDYYFDEEDQSDEPVV